jgi:hypothetical protein
VISGDLEPLPWTSMPSRYYRETLDIVRGGKFGYPNFSSRILKLSQSFILRNGGEKAKFMGEKLSRQSWERICPKFRNRTVQVSELSPPSLQIYLIFNTV